MPWPSQSRRRAELPADWPTIRRRILHRDRGVCRIRGPHCTHRATDVDHAGDRDDHRDQALRAACHACHSERTTSQGHEAMRDIRSKAKHPVEHHPGLRA